MKNTMFFLVFSFLTNIVFANNRNMLEDFLNNPEENCHKIEFCCFVDNNVCKDTTYKFIRDKTKDGFEITNSDTALSFLPIEYHVQVIKVHFYKSNEDIFFGFNYKNQLIFIQQGSLINTDDLHSTYFLLRYLSVNPDSIINHIGYKYKNKQDFNLKFSDDDFYSNYKIICDYWFQINEDEYFTHRIIVKNLSNSDIYKFRFCKDGNKWELIDVNLNDDFHCPYCTDEEEK